MSGTLSYHNFSWQGDPKWAAQSTTRYAPYVVCVIFALSLGEIALGSIWVAQGGRQLSPSGVIHTILVPGLSFFNALPSFHLHLLLRNNPPLLALWFSGIFTLLFLISPLVLLGSCAGAKAPSRPSGLRRAECARGTPGGHTDIGVSKPVWDTMVAFQLLSMVCYATHTAMAYKVLSVRRWKKAQGVVDMKDPEEEERRKQKSHELWVKATRFER